MCELMAVSFPQPASLSAWLRPFGLRDEKNPDGWGLAWYPDAAVAVAKEPIRWSRSPLAHFLEGYAGLVSPLFIAHVREGTTGKPPSFADAHPFTREREGRDYVFAHNGTIKGPIFDLPTGRYRPLGATDSEQAFCHLLDRIDRRGGHLDDEESWRWLQTGLAEINQWGTFNVLFSDGLRLFVYHDHAKYKGLAFHALDEDGVIAATCPLDDNEWQPFEAGELMVLEAGAIRFSTHRPASGTGQSATSNVTGGSVCTA